MLFRTTTPINAIVTLGISWLLFVGITFFAAQSSNAQFAQTVGSQEQPFPEPIGNGPTAHPEFAGDNVPTTPPASSSYDPTTQSTTGADRIVWHIYRTTPRGTRMVMTIRPDQLGSDQLQQIDSFLGIQMMSPSQPNPTAIATDKQIADVQNVLAPYPGAVKNGSRTYINNDKPAAGYPKSGRESLYTWPDNSPKHLPTIRTFCRYLVILGVVIATIMMSLSAAGMVFGHEKAGSRVIATAGGLMLLLMSFTIWKVVQLNIFKSNSFMPPINQNRPSEAPVSQYSQPSIPLLPSAGRDIPNRFGVPLVPLGDAGKQ